MSRPTLGIKTLVSVPTGALAQQAHNTEFSDPDFGAPIKRVSAVSLGLSGGLQPFYSELKAFNKTQTLCWAQAAPPGGGAGGGFRLIDPVNPTAVKHSSDYGVSAALLTGYAPRWDPSNPARIWFWGSPINTTGTASAGIQTITLASASIAAQWYNPGDTMRVFGAGAGGGDHVTTVQSRAGSVVTMTDAAVTGGSNLQIARPDYLASYNLIIDGSGNITGRTITIIRWFNEYAGMVGGNGNEIWEEMSKDGRYIACFGRKTKSVYGETPRNHEIFAYDVVLGAADSGNNGLAGKGTLLVVRQDPDCDPGGANENNQDCVDNIDSIKMCPKGNEIFVMHQRRSYLGDGWTAGQCGCLYDRVTGAFKAKLSTEQGHRALCIDSSGQEWMIIDASAEQTPLTGPYHVKVRIPDGLALAAGFDMSTYPALNTAPNCISATNSVSQNRARILWNFANNSGGETFSSLPWQNTHISGCNDNKISAEDDFVIIEKYGTPGTLGGINDVEITKVYLDSKQAMASYGIASSLHVERLCHHRTGTGSPFATVSPNGDYVAFTSKWDSGGTTQDLYLMDLDWFGHLQLKTWKKAPLRTSDKNNGGHSFQDYDSWISVAPYFNADNTEDVIVTEGTDCDTQGNVVAANGRYANDLWEYSIVKNRWRLTVTSDPNPVSGKVWSGTKPIWGHPNNGMMWDPVAKLVLHHGSDSAEPDTLSNAVWAYNPAPGVKGWSVLHSGQLCGGFFSPGCPAGFGSPKGYLGLLCCFDPDGNRVIHYSGTNGFCGPSSPHTEWWHFSRATNTWSKPSPQPTVIPIQPQNQSFGGRYFVPMIWDTNRKAGWIFGHQGTASEKNDMWKYDPLENTVRQTVLDTASPVNQPSQRAEHNMAYDPNADVLLIYGGCLGGVHSNRTNDSWLYHCDTSAFELISGAPPNCHFDNCSAYLQAPYGCFAAMDINEDWWFLKATAAAPPPPPPPPPPTGNRTVMRGMMRV